MYCRVSIAGKGRDGLYITGTYRDGLGSYGYGAGMGLKLTDTDRDAGMGLGVTGTGRGRVWKRWGWAGIGFDILFPCSSLAV